MTRKILVYENALADEHPALERASQLASHNNAQLKIVDVVDSPSDGLGEAARPMRSLVEQERKDRLDTICHPLHDLNIEFTTELIRGRPFVEIVREVVHEGFQFVIKAATSAQPTDVMGIMGPVDMRLVRNCPCPVWLEAPGREVRWERILVAVDPQAEDDSLNEVLLEKSALLAEKTNAELHMVSAWEVWDESILVELMRAETLTQYVDDVQSEAKKGLDDLVALTGRKKGADAIHFRKGDPAKTILDYAASHPPDVLVMGTVGHANIRNLLIGDTTETVLRQINCSVLAIKPDNLFRA